MKKIIPTIVALGIAFGILAFVATFENSTPLPIISQNEAIGEVVEILLVRTTSVRSYVSKWHYTGKRADGTPIVFESYGNCGIIEGDFVTIESDFFNSTKITAILNRDGS